MQASIKWTEGMTFEASLDGHHFFVDADEQFGGKNKGPKPKGLTLVSLAGCTGMDVISILTKMRVSPKIEHFEIVTDAVIEKDFPKRIQEILIKYIFKGNDLPVDKLKQAIELSQETYCGVSATLKPSVKITYQIILNDVVQK